MTYVSPEEYDRFTYVGPKVRKISTFGRARRYAARVQSYLEGANRDPDGNLRPMREVVYECLVCFAVWCRMTDSRVVAAEACPYCGGRAQVRAVQSDE